MPDETLVFNGIDGDTGTYTLPPMSAEELVRVIRGEVKPENLGELRNRHTQATESHLGVKEGVDPTKLAEAGWGVIFPAYPAEDTANRKRVDAIREALQPLLTLREQATGGKFSAWVQGTDKGVRPGESKNAYLARHGVGPGPADPDRVPYYLLLVGGPEEIPYRFQSQLDVQYAVGRIHFDTLEEYANYAANVVAMETGGARLRRSAAFFGTANAGDQMTELSSRLLVDPLAGWMRSKFNDWGVERISPEQATKATLSTLLGGDATPALLFSACHGMTFAAGSPRQLQHQGALICQDWPGPLAWAGALPQEFYFAADDLATNADLLGLIACFFACYGIGTPQFSDFGHKDSLGATTLSRPQIAAQPFLSRLPQRMLGKPRGALAVVGHIERAWSYSFNWSRAGAQTVVFESMLQRLLMGHPLGSALEYFNERYAELSTVLSDELEDLEFGKRPDHRELAGLWTANNDARGYAIIGDPAVRLPVARGAEQPIERTTIALRTVTPPPAPQSAVSGAGDSPQPPPAPVSSGEVVDPLAQSFAPPPAATNELDYLKQHHHDLYAAYVEHVKAGYSQNGRIFEDVRRAFMRSHNSTLAMYWLLFAIGAGTVVTAIVLALQGSALVSALFLGVGVAAFVGYFIGRSVISVEENLLYITWLGVIYNSYWTHLAWATDQKTAQGELKQATADAISQLQQLIDRHAKSTNLRATLQQPNQPPNATPGAEQPAEA